MFETIILSGLCLGVVQVAAGIGIGLWIARRRQQAGTGDLQRAQQIAVDLDSITAEVSHSLQNHTDRVAALDERLRDEGSATGAQQGPVTELIVGVVGELLSANNQLVCDLEQSRSELAERMDELNEHRQQALTDQLTGLPNRRAFDSRLRDTAEAWRKRQSAATLLMIDVDHFKQFNDTHGHPAGDLALQTVAKALRSALRNHDHVARYGGEEFVAILPFTTLENALPAVNKALRAVNSTTINTPSGNTNVTISVGVAEFLPQEREEVLVERADQALYAAKEQGRNRAWAHTEGKCTELAIGPSPEDLQTTEIRQACDDLSASLASFMEETPHSDSATGEPELKA